MIICGFNIEVLKGYPDNSVDAVVTDAPYGLGKEPDPVEIMASWIETGHHDIKGKGFMSKEWDSFVPQPLLWKEVLRVLKPGAHALVFFGTRTYDWGVMAMRFAGFEIRDRIQWCFDDSELRESFLDSLSNEQRETLALILRNGNNEVFHCYGSGFPKSLDVSLAIDKHLGAERPTEKQMVGDINNARYAGKDVSPRVERDVTIKEPITDEAKQWFGWGTALKPANESVVIARKPLEKGLTIAQNVLKWGTGAINIDGCRIELQEGDDPRLGGRWPANVILDEEAASLLDKQTGILTSGAMKKHYDYTNNGFSLGKPSGKIKKLYDANSGGGSRFFYVAKASKFERNKGCENIQPRKTDLVREHGQAGTDNAFNRGATLKVNFHPCVKPVELMQYLCRLITPPGGIVLDPFAGSCTTGIACKLEGFNAILIEKEQEYCDIGAARIAAWHPLPKQTKMF